MIVTDVMKRNTVGRTLFIIAAAIFILLSEHPVHAATDSADQSSLIDDQKQLERLNKADFHPNVLPIILRNSDFMGLNSEQSLALKKWRKANFERMVDTMKEVISRIIDFQKAAISSEVTDDQLRSMQEEIFTLQRKVLDYKLSCRNNIMRTFTQENWDNFYFVLSSTGYSLP